MLKGLLQRRSYRSQQLALTVLLGTVLALGVPALAASEASAEQPADSSAGILQSLRTSPCKLPDGSFYVPATLQTIQWGWLPNRKSKAIMTVPSGSVVTFDTLSGEGMMEDQGRDPVKFFGKHGVPRSQILDDLVAIASSSLAHDFDKDGPHIIIGPVAIEGAEPGDVLKIDMISFHTRVPYGVICSEHGCGALPGEFPETPARQPGASAANPQLFNNIHTFVPIKEIDGKQYGIVHTLSGKEVPFPIAPFIGTLGAGADTDAPVISVPPGAFGGNMDFKQLTAGASLYVPVQLAGAMFFIGDPHMAQGDAEVALTAVEGSLRATLKLTILKAGDKAIPCKGKLTHPFAENSDYWMPLGLDGDLNEATKKAVRESIEFLSDKMDMDRATAMAYLSAATDFRIAEVVDHVKGVYACISKKDFARER